MREHTSSSNKKTLVPKTYFANFLNFDNTIFNLPYYVLLLIWVSNEIVNFKHLEYFNWVYYIPLVCEDFSVSMYETGGCIMHSLMHAFISVPFILHLFFNFMGWVYVSVSYLNFKNDFKVLRHLSALHKIRLMFMLII